jgi:LemA protein
MLLYVIIGILALIIIYVLVQYNSFIKLSNTVKEAFSTMDVYLKKRWDLIPNLVEVVKGYVKHESSVLEEVVKLRNLSYDKMSLADKNV